MSYLWLIRTPVSLLVRDNLSFGKDVTVTAFRRGRGVIRLSMVDATDSEGGSITLIFTDRPLALKKWSVTDAQGIVTTVSLLNVRTGMPLDAELFEFTEPDSISGLKD